MPKFREPIYCSITRDEDIYSELCNLRRNRDYSAASTSFSNTAALGVSRLSLLQQEWQFDPKDKADYCLKELVETEANYVDCLNNIRKNFIKSIVKMKESDKRVIFVNIKELGETHGGFYSALVQSVTGKSHKKVGDIFLDYKERFLKYGEFCADLPKAQEKLGQLYEKDDEIRKEIEECEESMNDEQCDTKRFHRLRDLLAVPMQRILKYHLLLGQLVKNSKEDQNLEPAYEAMLDVADYINEVKRDSEHLQVIQEIQTSITDWNVPDGIELKPYGRMRRDGELKVQSHDSLSGGTTKPKLRYMFVFDKILLTCKPAKNDNYSYKDSLKLPDFKLEDPQLDSDAATNTTSRLGVIRRDSTRWSYTFLLVHKMQLNAFTFYARTQEEKKKWMEAILEALSSVTPIQKQNSTHDPVMRTFDKPTLCSACHKYLKGLFYQGIPHNMQTYG